MSRPEEAGVQSSRSALREDIFRQAAMLAAERPDELVTEAMVQRWQLETAAAGRGRRRRDVDYVVFDGLARDGRERFCASQRRCGSCEG